MNVKTTKIMSAIAVTLAVSTAAIVATAREKAVEVKGTVGQITMNPEGDADGLLLEDGTQIKFPPHMSAELRATVAAKDAVTVKGFEERAGRGVRGETITNDKSGKSVVDTPPDHARAGGPPPPPPPGPRAEAREGLSRLTAAGKITKQLFGPRGDVNGMVLSSGAIVRVGPRVADSSKVSLEVGKQVQVTGFGTKNEFGESIEATEIK